MSLSSVLLCYTDERTRVGFAQRSFEYGEGDEESEEGAKSSSVANVPIWCEGNEKALDRILGGPLNMFFFSSDPNSFRLLQVHVQVLKGWL